MSNINDTYFDGYYKDIWKAIIPAELTLKEVEFMIPYFHLDQNSSVLDLMCGYGRHATTLGRKGIPVIAVDNLPDYIKELNAEVEKENLPVKAIQESVLDFTTNERFDLAICMGNSLNFFNGADTAKILSNVSDFLKPGGHLLVNTWSIAEIANNNFKEKSSGQVGEVKFLTESKMLNDPFRIETVHTIISVDGTTEIKKGIDYIFSLDEIESMLQKAGLALKEVYSIPGRKKFTIGEPRAYLVAQKD